MTEVNKNTTTLLRIIATGFIGILSFMAVSCEWVLPLTYTHVRTPRELLAFLESRRQDIKGIKVNRHLLEIGKRPSLQILKNYNQVMYQMRPYRQINLKFRNFTKAEVMDFCTNITADGLENLRSVVASGKEYTPVWKGNKKGREIAIVRVTQFTYLVTGLADRPLFMGQVELAKRLNMDDATELSLIIPAQVRWFEKFKSDPSLNKQYPVQFLGTAPDELIEWLGSQVQ